MEKHEGEPNMKFLEIMQESGIPRKESSTYSLLGLILRSLLILFMAYGESTHSSFQEPPLKYLECLNHRNDRKIKLVPTKIILREKSIVTKKF